MKVLFIDVNAVKKKSIIDGNLDTDKIIWAIEQAQENYRKSLNKGLLKIMSKMGICTISSYRGSELFEIIGLNSEIINNVFKFSKTKF